MWPRDFVYVGEYVFVVRGCVRALHRYADASHYHNAYFLPRYVVAGRELRC